METKAKDGACKPKDINTNFTISLSFKTMTQNQQELENLCVLCYLFMMPLKQPIKSLSAFRQLRSYVKANRLLNEYYMCLASMRTMTSFLFLSSHTDHQDPDTLSSFHAVPLAPKQRNPDSHSNQGELMAVP